ncbi:MAG: methionyl-tRNA formyltransferase [Deltaproteobacteria bacterium]|nr:methionyl-tRNA formyltransferase [Deltaproteobacteria bacterium]MBW2138387.1 methionyl-tRNA formyltransferase [Deltaproteobacteria bacterium]
MPPIPSQEEFPARPKLMLMGTPEFALPALQSLLTHGHEIVSVVTQPDRPKGRGKKPAPPPVKLLAAEKGLEVLQPERVSDRDFCNLVRAKAPDMIIVIAFGQILKRPLLEIPKWGVINIHASLLPKYRGAAPIQASILNNDPKTGLTVMRMDEGLDTGPILYQEEVAIMPDETAGHLHDRLAQRAGDVVIRFLKLMGEGKVVERPQDHTKATYAPKIDRRLSLIDWERDAARISALIRALDPRPGAITTWEGKEMKLFSSRVADEGLSRGAPGEVLGQGKEGIIVSAGRGAVEVREIQLPGKKRLDVETFLRGCPLPAGSRLGS